MMLRHTAIVIFLTLIFSTPGWAASPTPPLQPTSGPGSADYAYSDIKASSYGSGERGYWIFQPKEAEKPLPVIVFCHGWGAMNPAIYGNWIGHLVRKGNIVVYPRWQNNLKMSPERATGNAIASLKEAVEELKRGKHAKADLEKFAVVGHSMGGVIAANIAALAGERNLPVPSALMAVQPGKTWNGPGGQMRQTSLALESMGNIAPHTLMLVVVGDRDTVTFAHDAKLIFNAANRIKKENKNYVVVHSDTHGKPTLIAGHSSPTAIGQPWSKKQTSVKKTDAVDYFAYWKLFDALTDAAFYGKNRNIALGNTEEQRFMGTWSDGKPVTPLTVTLPK